MAEGMLLEEVPGQKLAERILDLLDAPQRIEKMGSCSLSFMSHNAAERIAREIQGGSFPNSFTEEVPDEDWEPLLSDSDLLNLLTRAWQREQDQYEVREVIVDSDDLDYYRHRAAALLTSPSWPERNLGVKLIGLLQHEEKLFSVLHLLADQTPATRLQRFFGGDFRQVGFIRRNVLIALQIIHKWGPEVEGRVLDALGDNYYEVRAQAARTIGCFAENIIQKEPVTERLMTLINDRSFEVVREVVLALGSVGQDQEVAEALFVLNEHRYWQVREAALKAITRLAERRVVTDREWLLAETSRFILTTTDFRSYFDIKETYRKLHSLCQEIEKQEEEAVRQHVSPPSMGG
jgi:UDP-N-acetylglucosamine--N-acetylmuramyl-(pentapeptide) pyrophosphoryl-undecaprenol N-acetylglucosamine transferase